MRIHRKPEKKGKQYPFGELVGILMNIFSLKYKTDVIRTFDILLELFCMRTCLELGQVILKGISEQERNVFSMKFNIGI